MGAMSSEISKKEFLKRYLENEAESERKKKKKSKSLKSKANVPCLKIVDEDIGLKSINFGEKADEEVGDDAPVIAEVIDERPLDIKLKEQYESSRWKKIDNNGLSVHQNASMSEKSSRKRHDSDNYSNFSPSRSCNQNEDNDSDISPPCRQSVNKQRDEQNILRRRRDSDSDISPPRHQTVNMNNKPKSSERRHDSDSDISPPRHLALNRKDNQAKSSYKRHDSGSDISPPRHQTTSKRNDQNRNLSRRGNSDSDISPPRHQAINRKDGHVKSSSKRHDSDGDISPPRHQSRKNSQAKSSSDRHNSDSDISPPRHQTSNQKAGPVKRSRWQDSDSDLSPPRSSLVLSAKGKNKLGKTLSGLKAGLQNSKSLQEEVQNMRKREKTHLNMLDDEISGRNAETVVRDRKTGMKRDLDLEQEAKRKEIEKAKEYLKKYEKWGKGTEQSEDKLEKFKDDLHEMQKPLARYKDDEDLDERLKSIIHDDDPMSEYMKKKRKKDTPDYPVYSGPPAPPNRFGIQPGYRWDGVDRSNGFEKKYFEKINSTKAVQDEAYLWSVQDM